MAMRFKINFYIHIYQKPLCIIKNFDNPTRDVHISYHEGRHYNSVRLIGDTGKTPAKSIQIEKLGLDPHTTTSSQFIDYNHVNDPHFEENEENTEDIEKEIMNLELEEVLSESKRTHEKLQQQSKAQEEFEQKQKEQEELTKDVVINYDSSLQEYYENCYNGEDYYY